MSKLKLLKVNDIVDNIVEYAIRRNLKILYVDGTGIGYAIIDLVKEKLKNHNIKIVNICCMPKSFEMAFVERKLT